MVGVCRTLALAPSAMSCSISADICGSLTSARTFCISAGVRTVATASSIFPLAAHAACWRKITVNHVDLVFVDVVGDELFQRVFIERFAARTLVVAENLQCDGSGG